MKAGAPALTPARRAPQLTRRGIPRRAPCCCRPLSARATRTEHPFLRPVRPSSRQPLARPERVLFAGAVKWVSGFSSKSYPPGPSSRPGVAVVSPYLQVVRPRFAPGAPPGPAASPTAEWQRPGNAQPCPGTPSGWTGGQKVGRLLCRAVSWCQAREWLARRAGVRGVSRPRWMQSRSPVALPGP
jgi:hypothetical protein